MDNQAVSQPITTVTKHAGGRPLKYKNAKQLEARIKDYFANCQQDDKAPTVTALALHLGIDRRTILEYRNRGDELSPPLNRAITRIESYLEQNLVSGKSNVAGLIFTLKNNYGWVDRTEVANANINVNVEPDTAMLANFTDYLNQAND